MIKGISSMATRQLLAELVADYKKSANADIHIESVGGVDAAKRVLAGEAFDVVILASDAIDKLIAAGHVDPTSKVDLVNSGVAVAVKAGAASPDISSEAAVKAAVLTAKTISYSTGPSGVALAKLFEHWGIEQEIASRIVQAPPGVPVGSLVAKGEVELGFQQRSELKSPPRFQWAFARLPPKLMPCGACWLIWLHRLRQLQNCGKAWKLLHENFFKLL
jgi:molybdate transport system substrate-binding protein